MNKLNSYIKGYQVHAPDKLILFFLKIVIISIFNSCKSDQSNNIPIINPATLIEEKITLSEITSDINYIPLSNEVLFGEIVRIELGDSLIFVAPAKKGLCVYSFDGSFKTRLGKKGRGPSEYIYGYRFTLDKNNEKVYILDEERILKYTFTGQFLVNIPLKTFRKQNFNDIIFSNDRLYLYEGINLGYGKYDWIVLDTLGNILTEKLNSIEQFSSAHYCHGGKQEAFNKTLYYWNQINDTIFKIDEKGYTAAFLFEQGEFRFPKYKIKAVSTEYFFPRKILFTNSNLFFSINYQFQNCTGIYKIPEQQLYIVNKTKDLSAALGPGIINDFDEGLPFVPLSYYCNNKNEEFLIGEISPFELKTQVASQAFKNSTPKYPEKKKELEKLANSLDENDNPVLMLVKLKD